MQTSLRHLLFGFAMLAAVQSSALARSGCELATEAVLQEASHRGWHAQVQCSRDGDRSSDAAVDLLGVATDRAPVLRSGTLAWPLRVQVKGGQPQIRWQPLQVRLRSEEWVAVRTLTPGESALPNDFQRRWVDWPSGERPASTTAPEAPPQGTVLRQLRAGQVVHAGAMAAPGSAQRGDRLTLVLVEGPMELRLPARLMAAGVVGQIVKVQPLGSKDVLTARLTTPTMALGVIE
jgi:flagella basal body P-ring formation protein FlgA